jgi:hypothetical protein
MSHNPMGLLQGQLYLSFCLYKFCVHCSSLTWFVFLKWQSGDLIYFVSVDHCTWYRTNLTIQVRKCHWLLQIKWSEREREREKKDLIIQVIQHADCHTKVRHPAKKCYVINQWQIERFWIISVNSLIIWPLWELDCVSYMTLYQLLVKSSYRNAVEYSLEDKLIWALTEFTDHAYFTCFMIFFFLIFHKL